MSAASGYNLLPFIEAIKNDSLIKRETVQDIPEFIKLCLDTLLGDRPSRKFLIANSGDEWQSGCSPPDFIDYSTKKISVDSVTGATMVSYSMKDTVVARNQLTYFGIGRETALLKYYSGGIAKMEHIILFLIENQRVVGLWSIPGQIFKEDVGKEEILLSVRKHKEMWPATFGFY
jgi:hypothetical protein